jgi:GH24 family phage-related lysozyme (muramidase)
MDYQDAKDIRKKSFGTLLGEQEGGLGTSLKKTLSLKSQARMTGIKETFDPMNLAKKATFGSNWAPAMVGKMMGRDQKSMEHFTGAKFKKGSTSPIDDVESGSTSEPVKLLGLIYKELLRAQEYRKLQQEEENNRKKEKDKEESSRDEQLIEAVTGRKPRTRAQKKAERRKRRKEEKKEVTPTKEAPKGKGKEEAPKAPTEKPPKAPTKEAPKPPAKEAPKEVPKETPKAPEKVPAKEVPKEVKEVPKKVEPAPKAPAKEAPPKVEKAPPKEAAKAEKITPKVPKISGGDKDIMEMIKVHEGVRTKPYKDSLGLWTVGVGHLIGDGKSLPPEWNRELSMQEVDELFAKDYAHHKEMAMKTPGWDKANETGQAAMIDLAFNMGGSWYKKWPNTAKALEAGDFDKAADGLKDSKWYQQVKGRAVKIVSMIREGGKENSTGMVPKNQALPATLNPTTGTQINEASKENKNLKEALNKDKATNTLNNTTNIKQTTESSKTKTEQPDDTNLYLKKARA